MPLPPWVIEQLEEERVRREQEERLRSSRIELPHTSSAEDEDAGRDRPVSHVQILDISPAAQNTVDI